MLAIRRVARILPAMNIYTVGYEGSGLADFLRVVAQAGVRRVVDVREMPLSRKRGFSKTPLALALETAGIGYLHMRSLGCPKPIRDRYRAVQDWGAYTASFMEYLGTQATAIDELARLCAEQPSAVLCYEADPGRCHRTYVARAAAAVVGGEVLHITSDAIVPDQKVFC